MENNKRTNTLHINDQWVINEWTVLTISNTKLLFNACFWTIERNQSTWRKPTHTLEDRGNSKQKEMKSPKIATVDKCHSCLMCLCPDGLSPLLYSAKVTISLALQWVKACLTCTKKDNKKLSSSWGQQVSEKQVDLCWSVIPLTDRCVCAWFPVLLLLLDAVTVCICMCVIPIVAPSPLHSSVRRVCFVLTYGATAIYLHL